MIAKKYLITSALPYINGIKHLGNLIGSLLPADVYARHLRQQGEEVLYICGTDEHGTPAELAAKATGRSIEEYCQAMYAVQKNIYEQFGIEFDHFGRTSSVFNHRLTQQIFTDLDQNGFIEAREIQQVYSIADQRFLPDRYIVGTCPHCGYDKARGDQCEGCDRLLNPTDLLTPRSAISDSTALEVRSSRHLFLKLEKFSDQLKIWIDQHPEWPAVVKGTAYKWLTEGLRERCISRDLDWGVKIPKAGFEDKVFYVWFDAPLGYISFTQEWAQQQEEPQAWLQWWRKNLDDVHYTEFMAKDNVPFHVIFWPAMMMGAGGHWKFPDMIKGFNWLTYEGGKFSTSQQRGVFMDQALELFPADYWRYYLIANAPESDDTDFTFRHFCSVVNKDLSDALGNFVSRVTALIHKYFAGAVPMVDRAGIETVWQLDTLQQRCEQLLQNIDQAQRELKYRQAAQQLRSLWVLCNEYITQEEPWKFAKKDLMRAGLVLSHCLHLIRIAAIASAAIIPNSAQKIWAILGQKNSPQDQSFHQAAQFNALLPGQAIQLCSNLFPKITDEQVEALQAQFKGKL